MRHILVLVLTASLVSLGGCLSIGNGHGQRVPTMAEEIKSLKDARAAGDITESEYHMGMSALGTR